jgi:3-hydroxyacyl-[acyl-carrier-protein] dehydratase
MLLIDEAERLDEVRAEGSVLIRGDEWFLQGHFPNKPVVPGVILCEMIAQTCCVTVLTPESTGLTLFTGIKNCRFVRPVVPGDRLRLVCELTSSRPPFFFARGEGYVGDELCVRGDFSFALMPQTEG